MCAACRITRVASCHTLSASRASHCELASTAMRQMQPVLWTKGVLLSPQHFQTQDRFLEDLLEFQLSALTFCPWGFHRLEVDREALAAGSFGLSAAAGIL